MSAIVSRRLELVPGTLALLDAELESTDRLAALLGAQAPPGWPPGEYDRGAMEHFRRCLSERPDTAGWYGWYAILRGTGGRPPMLVGAGGYFGPPDGEGVVEIGYSFVPEFGGRGYATELVEALAGHAFATGRVRRIIAHTDAGNAGSRRVLEKAGFSVAGPGEGPGVIEYALCRPGPS